MLPILLLKNKLIKITPNLLMSSLKESKKYWKWKLGKLEIVWVIIGRIVLIPTIKLNIISITIWKNLMIMVVWVKDSLKRWLAMIICKKGWKGFILMKNFSISKSKESKMCNFLSSTYHRYSRTGNLISRTKFYLILKRRKTRNKSKRSPSLISLTLQMPHRNFSYNALKTRFYIGHLCLNLLIIKFLFSFCICLIKIKHIKFNTELVWRWKGNKCSKKYKIGMGLA